MANKQKRSDRRAGKRRDRSSKVGSRAPELGYYLIVTDTEKTERSYFEGLRDSIPEEYQRRIVIHVEKAKTTYNLLKCAAELNNETAQQRITWIVFDRDEVKDFDGMIREVEEQDYHAGWSNPCFEIWMFAYFGTMPNIPDSPTCCRRFEERFERMTGQKYKKNDEAIYRKLDQNGNFNDAYKLAEQKLVKSQIDEKRPSEAFPACTIHHLVKEIKDKIDG